MSVGIGEGGFFKTLAARTGALAADLAPTPAIVDPDEVCAALGAKQIAVYWDGTAVGGATTVDLEVWVLDGTPGVPTPRYQLVDAAANLSPNSLAVIDCHGANHFVVRITNPQNIATTTDVFVRAYGVPYG